VTLRRPITLGFVWDIETRMLVFFLVLDSTRVPTVAFGLELFQEADENDLKFARSYGRKFNDDLRAAPEVKNNKSFRRWPYYSIPPWRDGTGNRIA
jgi:hypothetical protein